MEGTAARADSASSEYLHAVQGRGIIVPTDHQTRLKKCDYDEKSWSLSTDLSTVIDPILSTRILP